MLVQLEFFKTPEECFQEQLIERIDKMEVSQNKVRRAVFARDGKQDFRLDELEERVKILERFVCRR